MFGLFQSKDTEKSIVDGLINGIDSVVLTDQERIQFNQRKIDLIIKGAEIKTEQLKLFEPYKVTQRIIALLTFVPFIIILIIAFYLRVSGQTELATAVFKDINENLVTLVMMIASFYYAGSIISNIRGK